MHLTGLRHFFLPSITRFNQRTAFSSRRRFLLAAIALPLLLLAGCGDDSDGDGAANSDPTDRAVEKVTFMAGFKPQANLPFVGAYVAQEKGFFADQDLEVEIRHAQSGEHLKLLLAGTIQFATANGGQVVQRNAEDLPLVSIALIGQKSEQGFIVGADSGIETVQDWAGKRFGYKGSVPVEFLAITEANGLDPDDVEQVSVGFDPRELSEGRVDILAAFISNEPGQLERIGYPTRLFDPSDYGIPALGLTYIATRDMVENNPDVVERFQRAVLHGIEYANDNREEALDIVMQYAPQEDRDQQAFMLNTELDRAQNENGFGYQTTEQWQALADVLLQYGVIEKEVDVSTIFRPVDVLQDGEVIWP